ncbi:MAG: OmpA family protein [Bacteroidales bacterium]|nr:OmpA family protein [Bacteroidales bacterium]
MRYLILIFFIFLSGIVYSQTKKIRYDYGNGSIESTGKVITCPDYDNRFTFNESKCRKIGKWIYYYQNGNIKSIEKYKIIKDCNSTSIANGIWQYYNERGILIKEEEYKNGILWKSDISKYYYNKQLAGEILVRDGIKDTIVYLNTESLNMIKNGDFILYYEPPQLMINNGYKQIESQIPFWITPNSNTPDYYNQLRRLVHVPDNFHHDNNTDYNYVGIILYHQPTGNYSEYITGMLNKRLQNNQKYLIKLRIRLSQNSGYYIDKFGILLSKDIPTIPNTIEKQQYSPQISYNKKLENRDDWVTLCFLYTALGYEKYITLGRFSSLSETTINEISPLNQSEGEYNLSAYYLIDEVLLLEDTAKCICENQKPDIKLIDRKNFDLLNPSDSIEWRSDRSYILQNVYFDFDKSALLPASFPELEKLLTLFSMNNFSITISGHTDNIGTDKYNKQLSLARAKAVSDWLIENGIESNRIRIIGYGAEVPIVDNNSSENRAINRRVEFRINK